MDINSYIPVIESFLRQFNIPLLVLIFILALFFLEDTRVGRKLEDFFITGGKWKDNLILALLVPILLCVILADIHSNGFLLIAVYVYTSLVVWLGFMRFDPPEHLRRRREMLEKIKRNSS